MSLFYNFLKIWNTYNNCFGYPWLLIWTFMSILSWFHFRPHFHASLHAWLFFAWMPDTIYFTFMGTWYICTPVNILNLCSVVQLSYLQIGWPLWILLLRLVKWDWRCMHHRYLFPTTDARPFCALYPIPCESRAFPVLLLQWHFS